jgi:predicted small secreted protein
MSTSVMIVNTFLFGIIAAGAGTIMVLSMIALKERSKINYTEKSENIKKVMGNVKISWPLYISLGIFTVFAAGELLYIITGISMFSYISGFITNMIGR